MESLEQQAVLVPKAVGDGGGLRGSGCCLGSGSCLHATLCSVPGHSPTFPLAVTHCPEAAHPFHGPRLKCSGTSTSQEPLPWPLPWIPPHPAPPAGSSSTAHPHSMELQSRRCLQQGQDHMQTLLAWPTGYRSICASAEQHLLSPLGEPPACWLCRGMHTHGRLARSQPRRVHTEHLL